MNRHPLSNPYSPPAVAMPSQTTAASNLIRRLGAGAIWVILGRGMGILANALTGAVLARVLSPDDAGAYVIAMNAIMFGGMIGGCGLGGAVVRFISEHLARDDRAGARRILSMSRKILAVTAVTASVLMFASLWLASTLGIWLPVSPGVLTLLALAVGLLAWQQIAAESLRGYHELRFASFLSGGGSGGPIANVIFLLLTIAAAPFVRLNLSWTMVFVVAGLAISFPVTLLLLRRTSRIGLEEPERLPSPDSEFTLRDLLRVCLPMLGLQVLGFVTLWADLWTAGAFLEPDQVALYGFARRLVALVALPSQLAMLTVLSSIPDLYAQRRLADLQRMLRGTALLAAIPAVVAAAALIIAPAPILGLYYAPFYRAAAMPLSILAAGQILVVLTGVGGYTLLMTGRHNAALLVNLFTAALVLVASPLAAWKFGIVGLATVAACAAVAQAGLEWLLAGRLLGIWTHVGFVKVRP